MRENSGPIPVRTPETIQAMVSFVFEQTALEGQKTLQRFSQFSPTKDSLSPGQPAFESLPSPTQGLIRRSIAAAAVKPIYTAIVRGLTDGVFDQRAVYEETDKILECTSVKNPFAKPNEPQAQFSITEWQEMVRIAAEDPTRIRFFNKGFRNLPYSMRSYFNTLGVSLFFIHDELIPEIAVKLEEVGVPRTYRKKTFKKVEVAAEHPFGTEFRPKHERDRSHAMRKRRVHNRRRRGSIWPTY